MMPCRRSSICACTLRSLVSDQIYIVSISPFLWIELNAGASKENMERWVDLRDENSDEYGAILERGGWGIARLAGASLGSQGLEIPPWFGFSQQQTRLHDAARSAIRVGSLRVLWRRLGLLQLSGP